MFFLSCLWIKSSTWLSISAHKPIASPNQSWLLPFFGRQNHFSTGCRLWGWFPYRRWWELEGLTHLWWPVQCQSLWQGGLHDLNEINAVLETQAGNGTKIDWDTVCHITENRDKELYLSGDVSLASITMMSMTTHILMGHDIKLQDICSHLPPPALKLPSKKHALCLVPSKKLQLHLLHPLQEVPTKGNPSGQTHPESPTTTDAFIMLCGLCHVMEWSGSTPFLQKQQCPNYGLSHLCIIKAPGNLANLIYALSPVPDASTPSAQDNIAQSNILALVNNSSQATTTNQLHSFHKYQKQPPLH